MWRYLMGAVSALLLAGAGLFWWQARQEVRSASALPSAPFAAAAQPAAEPIADPPQATEKTREERRFARYDRDKDGGVGREEYLAARRKAFAKLDLNGDGRLQFEEYAVKTIKKFADADADRSGVLTPAEFARTRVVRKTPVRPRCDCSAAVATAISAREEAE